MEWAREKSLSYHFIWSDWYRCRKIAKSNCVCIMDILYTCGARIRQMRPQVIEISNQIPLAKNSISSSKTQARRQYSRPYFLYLDFAQSMREREKGRDYGNVMKSNESGRKWRLVVPIEVNPFKDNHVNQPFRFALYGY